MHVLTRNSLLKPSMFNNLVHCSNLLYQDRSFAVLPLFCSNPALSSPLPGNCFDIKKKGISRRGGMQPIGSLSPFMQKPGKLERSKQEQRILAIFDVVLEHAVPFQVLLAFDSLREISRKTAYSQPNWLLYFLQELKFIDSLLINKDFWSSKECSE